MPGPKDVDKEKDSRDADQSSSSRFSFRSPSRLEPKPVHSASVPSCSSITASESSSASSLFPSFSLPFFSRSASSSVTRPDEAHQLSEEERVLDDLCFSIKGLELEKVKDADDAITALETLHVDAVRYHKIFIDGTMLINSMDEAIEKKTFLSTLQTIENSVLINIAKCTQKGYASNIIVPFYDILNKINLQIYKNQKDTEFLPNKKEIYYSTKTDVILFIEHPILGFKFLDHHLGFYRTGGYLRTTQAIKLDGTYAEDPIVELSFPKGVLDRMAVYLKQTDEAGNETSKTVNQYIIESTLRAAIQETREAQANTLLNQLRSTMSSVIGMVGLSSDSSSTQPASQPPSSAPAQSPMRRT